MPRLKIIILETEPGKINYAFWADVPVALLTTGKDI